MFNRCIRGLTALLAVALVSSPVSAGPQTSHRASSVAKHVGAVAPKTTSHKIALGVSMLPNGDMSNFTSFKNATGHAPAVFSIWRDWGTGTANPTTFPGGLIDQLAKTQTVPLIFWQPVGNSHDGYGPLQTSCGTKYSNIWNRTSGPWDGYIKQWADEARTKGTILMRFAHEMDGGWFPYGVSRCTNTATKFKAMWKHVVGIFRRERATNVKFVWSPLVATTRQANLYPGNSYVDYVGVTAFNWASSKNRPWLSLKTLLSRATTGLTSYSSKPWIVAETASVKSTSMHSRPSWLTVGYNDLYSSFPRIKVIMYFNIDMTHRALHQPNWLLNTSADISAYRSLLHSLHFLGKVT